MAAPTMHPADRRPDGRRGDVKTVRLTPDQVALLEAASLHRHERLMKARLDARQSGDYFSADARYFHWKAPSATEYMRELALEAAKAELDRPARVGNTRRRRAQGPVIPARARKPKKAVQEPAAASGPRVRR